MQRLEDVDFYFVQTMPMEEKRLSMGWAVDESALPYLVLYYRDEEKAKELILDSDVVLFGWTEGMLSDLRSQRLSSGKLSFCVSERIYREGQWKMISPRGLMSKRKEHYEFRNKPVYLLCTGAYVASDFSLIKSYPGKMLKWGYFPGAKGQQEEPSDDSEKRTLGADAPDARIKLCWAGRLIELKHPEFPVKVASALKKKGYSFSLDLVGDGPLLESLREMVSREGLSEIVNITGGKKPSEVLQYMKEADVFLFTSNYLEGWGAVVNEAMENGCAVVASSEAGSVPFLINPGENGLTYNNGSYDDFEEKVTYLFEHKDEIKVLGEKARETILDGWNADNAAKELVRFCKEFLDGKEPAPAEDGPMSKAKVIKAPGFIRTMQEKNHLE